MDKLVFSRAFEWWSYFFRMSDIKKVNPSGYPAKYPVRVTFLYKLIYSKLSHLWKAHAKTNSSMCHFYTFTCNFSEYTAE